MGLEFGAEIINTWKSLKSLIIILMAEWCFKTILLMIYLWKYFIVYIIQHSFKPFYRRKASIWQKNVKMYKKKDSQMLKVFKMIGFKEESRWKCNWVRNKIAPCKF